MNRLLPRFFALVMLSVTVASIAIYFAISYWFGDPLEEIARKQSAAQIFLLEQFVDKAGADEWLVRLNKVRDVSNIKYELIPLQAAQAALNEKKYAQLLKGEVVLDLPGKAFFRRVDLDGERYIGSDEDVIHVQGLPIDVGLTLRVELLRYAIVALFLLVPMMFWSRAHWRDLQLLSNAADEFGEGKFAQKITMNENATVYPLAQCMNTMAQRIENLLGTHRTLLHSVSHELRTPIARLEFGLELLSEEAGAGLPQDRIVAMQDDLVELRQLVNELLSLTRLDHQPALKTDRVAVVELFDDLRRAVAHQLEEKNLEIECDAAIGAVVADRRMLERALSNLLLNAIRYGNRRVMLAAQRLENGDLEFTVDDDGPGIALEQRERVFEAFYRIDGSRDRHTGGFGLGLAIAQKAVQLHGSVIRVETAALGGARFVFALPQQA